MTDKPSLRRHFREKRRAYCDAMRPADRARAFSVPPSVMTPLLSDQPVVAGYCAIGREADPARLLRAAEARNCPIALPWFADREAPMLFRQWKAGEPLHEAPFGGGQPAPDSPELTPSLLILPLVAFDRSGTRLGHGGGHYDRALEGLPDAVTVGLAWSAQEAAELPRERWDIPLTHILTEREWITP
ncbi:5-formyltetrahydrofolate cyclo-ligase [Novosphingopyxis iocasae]|uniref:5-formyltetrahydrofolate cyclo-ligase n=1 Tax=Novosphingopyxis iocasae TaxID=2762729 RepID=UPI001650E63A|nr:5-formyltetrahydrofolate cyclo-ligase [Novosphingopyxis iocasae]